MSFEKKQAMVLAHKVLGVASMGFVPSERLASEAMEQMKRLQSQGDCVAPDAIRALAAIRERALPGQKICQLGMNQIMEALRPLQMQERAERQALRESAQASQYRPVGG